MEVPTRGPNQRRQLQPREYTHSKARFIGPRGPQAQPTWIRQLVGKKASRTGSVVIRTKNEHACNRFKKAWINVGKRKGELSSNQIDTEFPHQVMVPASSVAGVEGGKRLDEVLRGLNVCGRHHSLVKDDEWQIVYCFADKADADRFLEAWPGEHFDPSSRGRGARWAQWRPPR